MTWTATGPARARAYTPRDDLRERCGRSLRRPRPVILRVILDLVRAWLERVEHHAEDAIPPEQLDRSLDVGISRLGGTHHEDDGVGHSGKQVRVGNRTDGRCVEDDPVEFGRGL